MSAGTASVIEATIAGRVAMSRRLWRASVVHMSACTDLFQPLVARDV